MRKSNKKIIFTIAFFTIVMLAKIDVANAEIVLNSNLIATTNLNTTSSCDVVSDCTGKFIRFKTSSGGTYSNFFIVSDKNENGVEILTLVQVDTEGKGYGFNTNKNTSVAYSLTYYTSSWNNALNIKEKYLNGYNIKYTSNYTRILKTNEAQIVYQAGILKSGSYWIMDEEETNSKNMYHVGAESAFGNCSDDGICDATILPVVEVKKFGESVQSNPSDNNSDNTITNGDTTTNNDNGNVNSSKNNSNKITTSKTDTKGGQTVKVDDTFKTAYIGYCIGSIILILGIVVMYLTYRKSSKEIQELKIEE